jgi:ubiquitin-conjugating enzyme E2 J1
MKPPSIILLTPSGRFEVNKKICLSISGHHPESWQPSWSIRTALLAIIGFMPTEGKGALGSLDYSPEERKALAKKSHSWSCPSCGLIKNLLKAPSACSTTAEERAANEQQKELAKQICFTKSPAASVSTSSHGDEQEVTTSSRSSESSETQSETGLRQRLNADTDAAASLVEQAVTEAHVRTVTNQNLSSNESSGQFTTYLMIVIIAALALLLFRRIFLM